MIKKKIVESGGHIDVAYGTFDRPGPKTTNEILPDLDPITPTAQVANQITLDRPPVDDEDYYPTCDRDLQLSLIELSKMIPSEKMKAFYKKIYNTAIDMSDKANKNGDKKMNNEAKQRIAKMILEAITDKKSGIKVSSDMIKKALGINSLKIQKYLPKNVDGDINKIVSIINDPNFLNLERDEIERATLSDPVESLFTKIAATAESKGDKKAFPDDITELVLQKVDSILSDIDYEAQKTLRDKENSSSLEKEDEDNTLSGIAKEFGYKGPSGASNAINLIKQRVELISSAKFDDIKKKYMIKFIDLLNHFDGLDEEDLRFITTLKKDKKKSGEKSSEIILQHQKELESLDSFRHYLTDLVIKPALKKYVMLKKDFIIKHCAKIINAAAPAGPAITKDFLEKEFSSTFLTINNQVSGETSIKNDLVRKKFLADLKNVDGSLKMTQKQAQAFDTLIIAKLETIKDSFTEAFAKDSFTDIVDSTYAENEDKILDVKNQEKFDPKKQMISTSATSFYNASKKAQNDPYSDYGTSKDKIERAPASPRDEEKERKKANDLAAKTAERDRKAAELKNAKDAKNKEENDKKDAQRSERLKLKSDKKQERMKANPKYAAAEKAAKQIKAALGAGKTSKGPLRRRRTED
jgi:hypothetical protein